MKGPKERVFEAIRGFLRERGYPPTIREIQRRCGYRTTSAVHRALSLLEEEGIIRRRPGVARGIELQEASPVPVPVLGRVQAGVPILAEENVEGYVLFERSFVPEGTFLLRVQGYSIGGAHILDGDYVLIKPQSVVEDGAIVVALIEGEVALKRFFRRGERVELVPSNPEMEPMVIEGGDLRIVGKVIGVLRFLERRWGARG